MCPADTHFPTLLPSHIMRLLTPNCHFLFAVFALIIAFGQLTAYVLTGLHVQPKLLVSAVVIVAVVSYLQGLGDPHQEQLLPRSAWYLPYQVFLHLEHAHHAAVGPHLKCLYRLANAGNSFP